MLALQSNWMLLFGFQFFHSLPETFIILSRFFFRVDIARLWISILSCMHKNDNIWMNQCQSSKVQYILLSNETSLADSYEIVKFISNLGLKKKKNKALTFVDAAAAADVSDFVVQLWLFQRPVTVERQQRTHLVPAPVNLIRFPHTIPDFLDPHWWCK